ncbi:MAG: TPM domain-containing protein [Limisphaerales bacterium]
METKQFLHALDDQQIAEAITAAEKLTSGEIRVFVSEQSVDEPVLEAEKQFARLGMTKTAQRNGVLIYFAPKSQKYAVVGDKGVHQKCGQKFWEHITEEMTPLLKAGKFTEAVVLAVKDIGAALAKEFPPVPGDRNELPNRVARDGSGSVGSASG